MKLYLDSSALVKLVRREAESEALRRYLRRYRADERVSSVLARVEVVRALQTGGSLAVGQARRVLTRTHLLAMDTALLDQAATLAPGSRLRTLDAIHLATALRLVPDLRAVITYDIRMAAAAATLGLTTVAPL